MYCYDTHMKVANLLLDNEKNLHKNLNGPTCSSYKC